MSNWTLGSDGIYKDGALCSQMYLVKTLAELEREVEKRKKDHGGGKYFDHSGNELSDDRKDEDDWLLTLIRSKKGGDK